MQLSGQTLIAASPAEPVTLTELQHHQLAQLGHHPHFSPLAAHHLKLGNTLLMMKSSPPPSMASLVSPPVNGALKCKSEQTEVKRELSNSSPISISVASTRTPSPSSSHCNGKSDAEDEEHISVSSPVKPHASPISNYPAVPSHLAKAYGAYNLGHHLPGQFPYPFGFPFPYAQQYDLTFANGLLSQAQISPNSQQSRKQHKPSTNFSVASLLGSKDEPDSKRRSSKDSKRFNNNRMHNSSYSEGEDEEDEDIDEELMEESAAAAASAAAGDDEDEEAVDMSSRHSEDRKISVTRLTPSPSPHQLSPPSSSRSASPLSPGYIKSLNGQLGKMSHPMEVPAALQLQLAAAAARHRFTVDGMLLDSPNGPQAGQQHHAMFGPPGQPQHPLLHPGNGAGSQQAPPSWMGHPAGHPALGGLPGSHPLNPFHWLAHTGPLSPSQSKCHLSCFLVLPLAAFACFDSDIFGGQMRQTLSSKLSVRAHCHGTTQIVAVQCLQQFAVTCLSSCGSVRRVWHQWPDDATVPITIGRCYYGHNYEHSLLARESTRAVVTPASDDTSLSLHPALPMQQTGH